MRLQVILRDYVRPNLRYRFDSETGRVEAFTQDFSAGSVGYGSWRRLGILRRTKVFVAVYARAPSLIVQIGEKSFNLLELRAIATRVAPRALIKRFSIFSRESTVYSCDYLFLEWESFPDNRDIFSFIEMHSRTLNDIVRESLILTAWVEGTDITSRQSRTILSGARTKSSVTFRSRRRPTRDRSWGPPLASKATLSRKG